ncbi:MAG: 1,4-dihydroxy-2-naphthoyl-CoA hydrolase [Chlamydiia bacterium]|nr:1,4-dihydroxy-2-naphthoyl-CoA hydrolase [Chlamydiia bacterium]
MRNFQRTVRVSDTDCTKALYFTNILKFTQEAFESLLKEDYPELSLQFHEGKIAFPIVQTSAGFFAPMLLGNELDILLDLKLNNTSFEVVADILHEGIKKGNCTIKHVCIDLILNKKVDVKKLLGEVCRH